MQDEATPPVDAAAAPSPDAAARKKEANRKKREKQKAKKAADAADTTGLARWQRGKLPGGRAERRSAGEERGMGVFALNALAKGELVAAAAPALSVVFDSSATKVCSFCFAAPPAGACTESEVTLRASESGSYGIVIDDFAPTGASEPEAIVTGLSKETSNREAVRLGDRIVGVAGARTRGKDAVVPALLEAAKAGAESDGVRARISRPALLVCQGCGRMACCASCVGKGRMAWHAYECKVCQALPAGASKGESSTIRMLLRYKVSTLDSPGEWADDKEPISLLPTLQGNAADVPPDALQQLSRLSGVPVADTAKLIFQIRTNACEVVRAGAKAGCALSVLMGWHNHSCEPNAEAAVDDDGAIAIRALAEIRQGDEICISYVDRSKGYEERQAALAQHYGFECRCARCLAERRVALKAKMHAKGTAGTQLGAHGFRKQ